MTIDTTYGQVVLGDRPGYLAVALGYGGYWDNGKYKHREWIERRYPWPAGQEQLETDVSQLRAAQEPVDVYVCAAVRFTDDRRKGSALPVQVLWTMSTVRSLIRHCGVSWTRWLSTPALLGICTCMCR